MREEQLNLNLESPKATKSSVRIKPQLQKIIDRNDAEINNCVDNIMDILHNPKRIAKYQANQVIKQDFEEALLSESVDNIINFDDFDLHEIDDIKGLGFLDDFSNP